MHARWFLAVAVGLVALGCGSSDDSGLGGSGKGGSGGSNTGGSSTGGASGSGTGGTATGGSAGTAAGGTAGHASGGTAGTSGGDCTGLEKEYASKLEEAKTCNSISGTLQCTKKMPNQLACPCETFVNAENAEAINALAALKTQWENQNCDENVFCPEIACQEPAGATCTNSDGKGSHCSDVDITPGG
jgi:hypothetical protein